MWAMEKETKTIILLLQINLIFQKAFRTKINQKTKYKDVHPQEEADRHSVTLTIIQKTI